MHTTYTMYLINRAAAEKARRQKANAEKEAAQAGQFNTDAAADVKRECQKKAVNGYLTSSLGAKRIQRKSAANIKAALAIALAPICREQKKAQGQ